MHNLESTALGWWRKQRYTDHRIAAQYKERIHAPTEKVARQSMAESASELRKSLPVECDTGTVMEPGKDVALQVRMV